MPANPYQYASTIVAWQDEPESSGRGWLVVAHVQNTGNRPVRDVSARWYADGEPIRDRERLTGFLLLGGQKNFDCRVDGASVMAGVKAIVQFRTVGNDWWSAGTDRRRTARWHGDFRCAVAAFRERVTVGRPAKLVYLAFREAGRHAAAYVVHPERGGALFTEEVSV